MRLGLFLAVMFSLTTVWAEDFEFYKQRYEQSRSIAPEEVRGLWKGKCNYGKGERQGVLLALPTTNEETKQDYIKAAIDIEDTITGAPNADAVITGKDANLVAFLIVLSKDGVVTRNKGEKDSYFRTSVDGRAYTIRMLGEGDQKEYNVAVPTNTTPVYCRLYNNKLEASGSQP